MQRSNYRRNDTVRRSLEMTVRLWKNSTYANNAATIAKTPAPAKVLSELAPPVAEAAAAEESDADSDEERSVALVMAVPVVVEVPVEVMVVIEPLVDMVEVTVEAG